MKLKILVLICFLAVTSTVYSQERPTDVDAKKAPLSIYTDGTPIVLADFSIDFAISYITAKQFKFLRIDQESIERNTFTIDFRNMGRKPSVYDFESYRKADLNKYFDVVPDIVVLNRFSALNTSKAKN